MTRINVVPVQELCDQHLLAEHREITRIPNGLLSGKLKYHYDDRPSEYVLGPGHVKFFTNKLGYLNTRYMRLFNECISRGFDVKYNWDSLALKELWLRNRSLFQGYIPTEAALDLNRERIRLRMPAKTRYTLTSPNSGRVTIRGLRDNQAET